MKTILFFMSGYSWAEQRGRDSVLRYAREVGWRIQCVPYAQAEASRYQLVNCSVAHDIKGLLSFWKPDGCIVECGAAPRQLQPADFGGLPVVFLDRDPDTVVGSAPCVCSDAEAIAKAAFDELLATGIRNFAYAGWYDSVSWSVKREAAFTRIVTEHGLVLHILDLKALRGQTSRRPSRLLKSINALPKPVAIFAVNDLIAEQIVNVCRTNGLSVPQEVAVVGVDNSPDLCENALVTISSIPQDHEASGRCACESLRRLMDGKSCAAVVTHGIGKVVRRASTRRMAHDARVLAALEFIRQYAASGIKVDEVVKVMGCSRRTADLLFSRHVGQSILSALTAARIDRVKDLLRAPEMPISAIAHMSGFKSVNDLDRVFKLQTGLTPNAWREQGV